MAVHLIPALRSKLLPVPTWLRTLTLIPLLAPLFALPFVPQPRLAWPSVIGWFIGVPLLIAAAVIGLWALREIGLRPSWKPKGLVTTGIYGIVQHPIYLSIILFAFGWALGFRAIYALLFVPLVVTS
jgi:protein-S-isoprenylcysteine O-methyltransferase Ste14